MKRTFVALDVETTGLDPDTDRITEVAAVRFDEAGRELGSFHSLVNPSREVPAFAEALTGLSAEELAKAPEFDSVAPELRDFVGDEPIVGHNVGFDLTFLSREGCALPGVPLDTAALARVLLPAASSHRLSALAELLGTDPGTSHRALDDARTTARVFASLIQRANTLDASLRVHLARLAAEESITLAELVAGDDWENVSTEARVPQPGRWTAPPPLTRRPDPEPPDPDAVMRVFGEGARAIPQFEDRTEQTDMAAVVAGAFDGGGHWLVEAGTGVGKSLAYLVPAALHALRTGERVIVSTNTIALQEQLMGKDLPVLRSMLAGAGAIRSEQDLRVAILKGRGNYLCFRRWLAGFAAGTTDPDFARLASRVILWLPETTTGDRAELRLDRQTRSVWRRFSSEGADCLSRPNAQVMRGQCFLARARRGAEAAHIVIVNHALLLADIASGGSALPSFSHLIVDEAHNLEEQATRQFGHRASRGILDEALAALWRPAARGERAGGIGALLAALPAGAAHGAGEALRVKVAAVEGLSGDLFVALDAIRRTGSETELLVTRGVRNSEDWDSLEVTWSVLDRALREAVGAAGAAREAVAHGGEDEGEDTEDLLAGEIEAAALRLESLRAALETMISTPEANDIVWIAPDRDGLGSLNSAPLEVGPILAERLFEGKSTVVATSATLAASGSMRFAAERLGLREAATREIGSPFDYERAALLAEITDVPDPGSPEYQPRLADALASLIGASEGRALVLFTSHASLRDAAARTRERLRERGITVLAQDEDGSPRELIGVLRNRPATAVFGTASFWEGVDVRGEALSLLIIARLPFAVPTDPIHQARSALKDNPFAEYALPAATLRFRQGFGRLIRDGEDRGAIVVLDRRVATRSYGPDFIRSLPPCTRVRGSVDAVAERVREWLRGRK